MRILYKETTIDLGLVAKVMTIKVDTNDSPNSYEMCHQSSVDIHTGK